MSKAAQLAALIGSGQAQGDNNLIINGAMQVAQRGTSAATQTTLAYHTVDRFKIGPSNMGTFTHTQESDGPDGFSKSVKLVCTTADASPAAADNITIQNIIEAQNLQHLSKGSSDAKSVTLSFYAKSNKTGTYTAEIFDGDNNRHISKTFTVSSSGTWEYKTITFVGDTSGALNNDNGVGFYVLWHLGAGSNFTSGTLATSWQAQDDTDRVSSSNVNLADTVGNYFQLTGVSLEIGDVATPFEHESFGETLQKCQRYYQLVDGGVGKVTGLNSNVQMMVKAAFDMRATPSLAVTTLRVTDCTSSDYADDSVTVSAANVNLRGGRMNLGMSSTASVGTVVMLQGTGSSGAPVQLSAEL